MLQAAQSSPVGNPFEGWVEQAPDSRLVDLTNKYNNLIRMINNNNKKPSSKEEGFYVKSSK